MQISETAERGGEAARAGAWLYLDEITHRALNDYTAMLAIIRNASMVISDKLAGQALDAVALRLRAGAAAWQALGPPSGRLPQNLDENLAGLCAALSESILADRQIKLSLTADPITISGHRCWQISLIIAELVLNAARHAFRSRTEGSIMVDVHACDRMIQCAVIDNGAAAAVIAPGRGSGILEGLALELGGSIFRTHAAHGSTVVLRVPLLDAVPTIEITA